MGKFQIQAAIVDAVQWLGLGIQDNDWGVLHMKAGSDKGWIDTPDGGRAVHPGDYLLLDENGQRWPIAPDIFEPLAQPLETIPPAAFMEDSVLAPDTAFGDNEE